MSNVRNRKIRVPATTVQLVQILGEILRDRMRLRMWRTECWTFEHVAEWNTPKTNEKTTVYLGSGDCEMFGIKNGPTREPLKLSLRVRCEYNRVEDDKFAIFGNWYIQMWVRLPNNRIARSHYHCDFGYGDERKITGLVNHMPILPPNRIAFWRTNDSGTISMVAPAEPQK